MDYSKLKSGQRTDSLICEKVFGVPLPSKEEAPPQFSSSLTHKSNIWSWHHGKKKWIHYPFSSDISQAWKILSILKKKTKNNNLTNAHYDFEYVLEKNLSFRFSFCTTLTSLPEQKAALEICRAALEVMNKYDN
ncbi:MAG TPA: hypothetical protein PLP33_30330 [Leptospiraceae bacterium]|nr:hypothetical protein [Leptospiraceae bacterium]